MYMFYILLFILSSKIVVSESDDSREYLLNETTRVITHLNSALNFILEHVRKFNFDGILGVTLAEANLKLIPRKNLPQQLCEEIWNLESKCKLINKIAIPYLPSKPARYILFKKYMLSVCSWLLPQSFTFGELRNPEAYPTRVAVRIFNNFHATYKGIQTDECMYELLKSSFSCKISNFCEDMMFGERNDTGYLLTHRLLYLQLVNLKRCPMNQHQSSLLRRHYCSLILKEAITNDLLGFIQTDLFLEQIVLCGNEGFTELLNERWRHAIMQLQDGHGCYRPSPNSILRRSSNLIMYGCTDHSTGLGAAALAINLRFLVSLMD